MSNRWCLALLGAVTCLGALGGAAFGWARTAACWCCHGLDLDTNV